MPYCLYKKNCNFSIREAEVRGLFSKQNKEKDGNSVSEIMYPHTPSYIVWSLRASSVSSVQWGLEKLSYMEADKTT